MKKYMSMIQDNPTVKVITALRPKAEFKLPLPEGAIGIIYVWKTKTAARKFYTRKVPLREIQDKQ